MKPNEIAPEIRAELVHELDADGKQLCVVKPTDHTVKKVRTLCAGPDELRARWADADQRADIIQQLAERGIDFPPVALHAGKPNADPFDLLCHLGFNAPGLTRRQRADRVKKQQAAFFGYVAPEAHEILNDLLEEYATDGEAGPVLFEQIESSWRLAAAINASRFLAPTCMLLPCLLH